MIGSSFLFASQDSAQLSKWQISLTEAKNLRYQHPDSSIQLLQLHYANAIEAADTTLAISALMGLAQIYGHQAYYKESYDRLWTALLLADAANLDLTKSSIYKSLGRYYSFYNRRENALNFLGLSLDIKKRLVEKGELDKARLVENYHAFCATYRELNEPELGQIYLDSSFMYHSASASFIHKSFLKFEEAVLLNKGQKYEEALTIFKEILPWYSENNPSYQVLVYNYMGDSYKQLGDFSQSEACYKNSLKISETFNSHIDFTPLVHERLSSLYYSSGDYFQAYHSMKTVKDLDAAFFDSRSENNRPLLEIQDAFRKEKEAQAILLQEQRLAQFEQEEKVLFLQRIILSGCIVFLILFGILYFNYVRSKHRTEKELIRKKQELEIQKTNELVELKNKELAASVLKLIEKDALVEKLKEKLAQGKGDIKRQEIEQIVRSVSNGSSGNWQEFEARFVSVNKSFYEKLNRRFPNLTQGDQKICALVKLNFSSKEIAKLLGNSVESVHTTRSRLRKKLKLSRDINLTEFIADV